MWADWIEAILTRVGFRVTLHSTVSKATAELGAEETSAAAGGRGAVKRVHELARGTTAVAGAFGGGRRGQ